MESKNGNTTDGGKNQARICISGVFQEDFSFNHETVQGIYLGTTVAVRRKSGVIDSLPIMIKESMVASKEVKGRYVEIEGELRSSMPDRHLLVYIYPRKMEISDSDVSKVEEENYNQIFLTGTIRKVSHRQTPFGRIIADIMVSVKRNIYHERYDYLPCIAWGNTALKISKMSKGDKINFIGRFQSRLYTKVIAGKEENRTAYEVSVMKLL